MGFIAFVLDIIALFILWDRPIPVLWWVIIGLFIFDYLCVQAVKNSIKINGSRDSVTTFWLTVATITQLSEVCISLYVIFLL